jgi:hypothetical protein
MWIWYRYLPNHIVRSTNLFVVGLQHLCNYGEARRSCTAATVQHVPGHEYGQNGKRQAVTWPKEKMQYLITKPPTEVREDKRWGDESLGSETMNAVIEKYFPTWKYC